MTPKRAIATTAVWLLTPLAVAQTQLFTLPGDAAGDSAGTAVASVGDVDADGADDFAIGSPGNGAMGNGAGMARVYSGRTRLPIHTWFGGAANERFGASLARAGDIDGDSHDDLLVGAPGGNYVDVLSGRTGLPLYRIPGVGGSFGLSVAGNGFVDGDAVPDILVGAPDDSSGGGSGVLYVFSGAAGSFIRSHPGLTGGCIHLGQSVTFYGDVGGDGRDEYAVGAPGGLACAGKSEVYAYDGASGTLLWSDIGAHNDQYGWSLAPLSDVTGDGVPEVLAGAPQDPGVGCGGCHGEGYVRLLDGATGSLLWQVDGLFWYSGLGGAVAAVGDVDGDGYEDFAASQPETSGGGGATRAVQIRDGKTGALLLQVPVAASQPHSYFGASLASGDVNDDGLRDLLVGTPADSINGMWSGATYAYTVLLYVVTYCQAKVNSQGCTPSIFATGTASLTAGNLRVKALDVVNNKNGLLFWGRMPVAMPLQGGYLCVVPPILRTTLQWSGGNPPPDDCSGSYSYQFTPAYMASKGMQAGDQIYCQYWSRDPQGFVGTSLTGGLAFYVLP